MSYTTTTLVVTGFPYAHVELHDGGRTAIVFNPGRDPGERHRFNMAVQDMFFARNDATLLGKVCFPHFDNVRRMVLKNLHSPYYS